LQPRVDPADVVQDTLMEAWRDLPCFRGRTERDLLVWLTQILRHNLANELRRHVHSTTRSTRREVSLAATASADVPDTAGREGESPPTLAEARERHDALQGALRRLPEHYRRALCLRTQEGLSFAQVGELLRCSAEAARKLWGRAAEELRRLLGDVWKT
jgi:RNA polymerase sigma-70 factor (ECF subfamily)